MANASKSHNCIWTDCDQQIPLEKLCCKIHWWKLTDAMRTRIWKEYKAYGRITIELVREIKQFIADYDKPPEVA